MELFVSHESALEYWRLHTDAPELTALKRTATLTDAPLPVPLLQSEKIVELSFPIHIMLSNPNARRAVARVKQHIFSAATPAGCFVNIGNGLMISSPEFCFLQLANELPLVKLIELGYELCGAYSMLVPGTKPKTATPPKDVFDSHEPPAKYRNTHSTEITTPIQSGFTSRPPLTTTKKLHTFLTHMPAAKGLQKALRSLRYVSDGAASPMETKLAILLTLPYKSGGYHFPLPTHNSRIAPIKTAKISVDKNYYVCDLFWPAHNLAVEYDSDSWHTGPERIARDSKRRNSLSKMGVTVITVTNRQLRNASEFESITRVIAGHIDRRLQFTNPAFAAAHRKLRKLLMI